MQFPIVAKMAQDLEGNWYIVKEESVYAEVAPEAIAAVLYPHFKAYMKKEGYSVDQNPQLQQLSL